MTVIYVHIPNISWFSVFRQTLHIKGYVLVLTDRCVDSSQYGNMLREINQLNYENISCISQNKQ